MLRVVVPNVYYHDPLDELFASPWSPFHHRGRAVPYCSRRRCGSMAYPTLAAFIEAMEAKNGPTSEQKSEQNCDKKCTSCGCQNSSSDQASDAKKTSNDTEPKQEPSESSQPSTSDQNEAESGMPSTTADSEETKPSEAVSVPMKKLGQSDSEHFQVTLNLKSFQPDDIEVTRVDNELKVHAKEQVERYGMVFHRELHRSYHLPQDVDVETLKSTLSTAGVLTIEAQRKPKSSVEDATEHQVRDYTNTDSEDTENVEEAPSEDQAEEEKEAEEAVEENQDPVSSSLSSGESVKEETDVKDAPVDKQQDEETEGQE